MVSPDSDLFRVHPDWIIHIPEHVMRLCRDRYVLDLTRRGVLEHMYKSISDALL